MPRRRRGEEEGDGGGVRNAQGIANKRHNRGAAAAQKAPEAEQESEPEQQDFQLETVSILETRRIHE